MERIGHFGADFLLLSSPRRSTSCPRISCDSLGDLWAPEDDGQEGRGRGVPRNAMSYRIKRFPGKGWKSSPGRGFVSQTRNTIKPPPPPPHVLPTSRAGPRGELLLSANSIIIAIIAGGHVPRTATERNKGAAIGLPVRSSPGTGGGKDNGIVGRRVPVQCRPTGQTINSSAVDFVEKLLNKCSPCH